MVRPLASNRRQDVADEAAADGVGLEQDQGALGHGGSVVGRRGQGGDPVSGHPTVAAAARSRLDVAAQPYAVIQSAEEDRPEANIAPIWNPSSNAATWIAQPSQ